jgi:hypothetical protein
VKLFLKASMFAHLFDTIDRVNPMEHIDFFNHIYVAGTELVKDDSGVYFRSDGKKTGGITRVLKERFPIQKHTKEQCIRCKLRGGLEATQAKCGNTMPGRRSKKRRVAKGVQQSSSRVAGITACDSPTDSIHGQKINEQVAKFAYDPTGLVSAIDPCTVTLLKVFAVMKWTPIDFEVAIAMPDFKCATAIDIVAKKDDGTLVICEVKTTRHPGPRPENADICYRTSSSAYASPRFGIPSSWYSCNQLQLFSMYHTVQSMDLPFPVEAYVIRTGPGYATVYPMDPDIVATVTPAMFTEEEAADCMSAID